MSGYALGIWWNKYFVIFTPVFLLFKAAKLKELIAKTESIFCSANETNSEYEKNFDIDSNGGKTFLRILVQLIMHGYPPLVTGSLKLLLRYFSKIKETLAALKQVNTSIFVPFRNKILNKNTLNIRFNY